MALHASADGGPAGSHRGAASKQEHGAWTIFWQHYLIWANRAIAAASNTYFLSALRERLGWSLLADVLIFAYTLVLAEVIGRLIDRRYRPRFVCAGPGQAPGKDDRGTLVLSEADFRYRTRAEKSLYETWILFVLNAAVGIVVCARHADGYLPVGLGAFGLFASFFTLAGVAIVVSTDVRTGRTSPAAVIFGLIVLAPGVGYVVAALNHLGLP